MVNTILNNFVIKYNNLYLKRKRELNDHLEPNVSSNVLIELASAEMPKKKRQKLLEFVFSDDKYLSKSKQMPKIVISSYHLVANMCAEFSKDTWDYVILDEGHTIKNPNTKISKAMHAIKSNHRLILTGTPIQNNLNEFYALVDWVTSVAICDNNEINIIMLIIIIT